MLVPGQGKPGSVTWGVWGWLAAAPGAGGTCWGGGAVLEEQCWHGSKWGTAQEQPGPGSQEGSGGSRNPPAR